MASVSGAVSASISIGTGSNGLPSTSHWWDVPDAPDAGNAYTKYTEENEKECLIYVIDSCPDMLGSDHWKNCMKAIVKSLKRKIIMKPSDPVSVMLYNTKETKLPDDTFSADEYKNITVVRGLQTPSASFIHELKTLAEKHPEPLVGAQTDFVRVLGLANTMIDQIDASGDKFGYKRVFFFTRNDEPSHSDLQMMRQKAKDMRDSGYEINLFPMKVQSEFSVMKLWQYIITKPKDEFISEKGLYGRCNTLEELEETIRAKEMKKRCLTTVPLSIGANFCISVKLYNMKMATKIPSSQWLDPKNNEELVCVTQFVCADTAQTLDDTQYETYHGFGDMQVPFTKEDMNEIKKVDEPSLRVMGFKHISRLKAYHQIKASYFIYPDEQMVTGSRQAFKVLMKACLLEERMAICRFTSRKGTIPRMVALVPQREIVEEDGSQTQPPGFHLHFLPYADDIRKPSIPPMRSAQGEDEDLIPRAKKVIKALQLKALPEFMNPAVQRHYDVLEALALEEELKDGDTVDETMDMFETHKGKYEKAKEVWGEFMEVLPEPQVKASRKRKAGDGGGRKKKAAKKEPGAKAGAVKDENDWKGLAESGLLKKKKVAELKQYLGDNGLSRSGKKADLIERIKNHLGVSSNSPFASNFLK